MKREILFRGKSIYTGKWLYGDLVHAADRERTAIFVNYEVTYDGSEVKPYSVGQFTGVYDRRDERVYEGDIVEWLQILPGEHGRMRRGRVEFRIEEGTFVVISNYTTMDGRELVNKLLHCTNHLTVVGNIYDNPELMKGGDT